MRVTTLAGVFAAATIGACTVFDGATLLPGSTEGGSPDVVLDGPLGEGFLSLNEAARLCKRVSECGVDFDYSVVLSLGLPLSVTNYAACMDVAAGPMDPARLVDVTRGRLRCIANAADCPSAFRCLRVESVPAGDPRCAASGDAGLSMCLDGGEFLSCTPNRGPGFVQRCTDPTFPPGTTCRAVDGGIGCLTDEPCSPGTSCVDGTKASGCFGDRRVGFDCSVLGLTCSSLPGCSGVKCSLSGTQCDPQTSRRLQMCSFGFGPSITEPDDVQLTQIDCLAVGGVCERLEGTTPHCVRPNDECKPTTSRCVDEDRIQLCIGGRTTIFDCNKELGVKCFPPSGGFSAICGERQR